MDEYDFSVLTGFNTKQLWVYESKHDVYIDPPKSILDELETKYGRCNSVAEDELMEIVKQNPDWLYETDYWYNAEDYDI